MSPPSSIAHYRITAKLGEGGMGEVWRATDTKLGREVAIKILPSNLSQDPERMARFEREAKVLASLNHPNIAQIHGIEDHALIMELVEGETLKGPLPVETVLEYARQIVNALEAAHEKGIVHRDLKPRNIMVSTTGVVKVLDFGLAKIAEEHSGDTQNSPTLTISPTRAGVILGTARYMAPEQARGKALDKRVDIWAFGCVLYEMLTGKPTFTGETTTDILAAVVTKEPDLRQVPEKVQRLLRRCLEKDPKKRLRDVGDAWELLGISESPATAMKGHWVQILAASLGISTIIGLGGWWRATRPVDHPLTRLSADLGPDAIIGLNTTVAISPDGRRLVFPARGPNGMQWLATRVLDQSRAVLMPGTESGRNPFFSPDGQSVGFGARGLLKKVSVHGGASVTLYSAINGAGSWSDDGTIVFTECSVCPLFRISAAGGTRQILTKLGSEDVSHRWPQFLPGGKAVLFTATPTSQGMEYANIEVISLMTGATKILRREAYFGRYVPSGHLLYIHQGVLFGMRFDAERLEVHGVPTPLLEDVVSDPLTGSGQFELSGKLSGPGTFVYLAGNAPVPGWPVIWLDRAGKTETALAKPAIYSQLRLSPDGRRLALVINSKGTDIFAYDWQRDAMTRITFDGHSTYPVWSPDGKHIAYVSTAGGSGISWVRSDGAGEPQRLIQGSNTYYPWSFSPDGRRLAYHLSYAEPGDDLWTLPLDITDPDRPKAGKPEPFLHEKIDNQFPVFSPDGRWIAYRSAQTNAAWEIYVRPFPGPGGRWQISAEGGTRVWWSRNRRELFFSGRDGRLMVVDYTANGDSFAFGKPRLWAEVRFARGIDQGWDLAADGERFVGFLAQNTPETQKGSVQVTFLLNFFDDLRRRVPAEGR
jgi:serine/threonine-protein kinase